MIGRVLLQHATARLAAGVKTRQEKIPAQPRVMAAPRLGALGGLTLHV